MAKLPQRFCITITGDTFKALSRENVQEGLARYLALLLIGQDVDLATFSSWGLKVEIDTTPWE